MKEEKNYIVGTRPYHKLDGAALKWIALITMVLDHLGAVVLYRLLMNGSIPAASYDMWKGIYDGLRMVGRTAFPIFCFCVVEGFLHTGCVLRYVLRMGIAALISEVPFDLAVSALLREEWNRLPDYMWKSQNVMFTLLLGLLGIWGMQELRDRLRGTSLSYGVRMALAVMGCTALGAAVVTAGWLLRTDYGGYGVLCILVLYLCYPERERMGLFGYMTLFLTDPGSLVGFLFILLYNGERGRQPKYLFYLFYPVHLAILFGVSILLTYYL